MELASYSRLAFMKIAKVVVIGKAIAKAARLSFKAKLSLALANA